MVRRFRTIGDAFSDLASQSSEFSSAWSTIQSQLTNENASQLDVVAAKGAFTTAFQDLTSSGAGFGLSSSDALKAATDYTIAGRTVLGAVDNVKGLAAAAQGDDPSQAFQMFTGTLIGAATAAGALSAGVGAVIVIGIGAALSLLKDVGLFGSPPAGQEICDNLWQNPPPTLQVGCVGSNATAIQVGSNNWRQYPRRSGGNTNDSDWFTNFTTTWAGSPSGTKYGWSSYPTHRLIDSAFPDAFYLSVQQVPSSLAGFNQSFMSGWTSNKEYELNGLKSQPDWQVLLHLVRLWNRAHQATSHVDLKPVDRPLLVTPDLYTVQSPSAMATYMQGASIPPYVQTLVQDLANNVARTDPIWVAGAGVLRINTGPQIVPVTRHINLHLPPSAIKASAPPATPTSTPWTAATKPTGAGAGTEGTTAAIVAGLAAVGAGAFYAYRQKKRRRPVVPPKLRAAASRLRRRLHL